MLSKEKYTYLEELLAESNCTYEEVNLKALRKGATNYIHFLALRNASTKDLVLRDVKEVGSQFPQSTFHVIFDGVSSFVIQLDGQELLQSNFYEVEQYYQIDYLEFRKMLAKTVSIAVSTRQ